jgi:hypothetical protein
MCYAHPFPRAKALPPSVPSRHFSDVTDLLSHQSRFTFTVAPPTKAKMRPSTPQAMIMMIRLST